MFQYKRFIICLVDHKTINSPFVNFLVKHECTQNLCVCDILEEGEGKLFFRQYFPALHFVINIFMYCVHNLYTKQQFHRRMNGDIKIEHHKKDHGTCR